jgi:hypothetical protein
MFSVNSVSTLRNLSTEEVREVLSDSLLCFCLQYVGTLDVPRPTSRVEIVAAMRRIRVSGDSHVAVTTCTTVFPCVFFFCLVGDI